MWIIAFGTRGAVGLASVTASLLLPVAVFCFHYPASSWLKPRVAPTAAMATSVVLFMFDSVLNDMFNPIFPLISGGLSGLVLKPRESLNPKKKLQKSSSVAVNSKVQRRPKQHQRLSRRRSRKRRSTSKWNIRYNLEEFNGTPWTKISIEKTTDSATTKGAFQFCH